jgi:hypothetical protein
MLKSSSLCLYSSNLGTFWLKIEQFWSFEEISIFSNSGHLEWRAGLSDINLKGTHPGTIPARRTITCLSFQIGQLYLVCGCMTIRWCVAYHNDLCETLTFDLKVK